MKLRYYIDIFPGTNLNQYVPSAMSVPFAKSETARRFAFDVVIPDELLNQIDVVLPETAHAKLVED